MPEQARDMDNNREDVIAIDGGDILNTVRETALGTDSISIWLHLGKVTKQYIFTVI